MVRYQTKYGYSQLNREPTVTYQHLEIKPHLSEKRQLGVQTAESFQDLAMRLIITTKIKMTIERGGVVDRDLDWIRIQEGSDPQK
jgi:hypothetical protein